MISNSDLILQVRTWLAENWDPSRDRREWRAAVLDQGYAVPRWPRDSFGLELSDEQARLVENEFRSVGAPGSGQDRTNMYANTFQRYASAALKEQLMRPLLEGRLKTCLLYSEPGAGSDLAGLTTRAVRDGEDYVVSGAKVWTSDAATAEYGMLVARTDFDVPKHCGISFFLFPMKQPGVVVRPLRQMTGEAHFNEVFLTDARVPAANMFGEPGEGWRVLQTALAYERRGLGERNQGAATRAGRPGETDLIELARRHDRLDDPVVRQDLARVLTLRSVNRWNNQRSQAELKQGDSSSLASLGKLLMSRILHETGRVQTTIVGPEAMLEGPENRDGDAANFAAMNAFFTSIGGGTDQIQRNIIGERILGLPREPEVDKDLPFREVKRSG